MPGTNAPVSDGMIEIRVLDSWVPPVAGAAPKLSISQWDAGIDITCDLLGDGLSRSTTENSVTIDRLCMKQTGEKPGSTSDEVSLTYAWDPQGPNTATAYGVLTPGSEKTLAIRYGVPFGTKGATAQKVDIVQVVPGVQQRVATARNEEMRVTQKQFVAAGGTYTDVALGAA